MTANEILETFPRKPGSTGQTGRRDAWRKNTAPHKAILVRTVSDGGESYYFEGPHRATLPALRRRLLQP